MIIFWGVLEVNEDNFRLLYNTYYNYVYSICRNILHGTWDIEDLIQEIFLIVYQTMGKIEDIPSAKPWIGTIARNAAINRLRKNAATDKWRADTDDETVYTYTPDEAVSDPLEVVINEESVEQVYQEMKKLGEIYENVLLLRYRYHFEVNEIAKMLQLNRNTTYSRLERGRCKLREKLINEKEGKKDEQKREEEYNGEKVRR